MAAQIYVTTYAKYNSGNILGDWLYPDDYENIEEFLEACKELHKDEEDPEFMFQHFDEIPSAFISESHIDPSLWDYLKYDADEGAKEAYMEIFQEWDSESFRDKYFGEFPTDGDMAEELLTESGVLHQIPENLRGYFDFDRCGRDMILGGDLIEQNGHYFWNH